MAEVPCYMDEVAEHRYNNTAAITGSIGGLKVSISERQVKIKDGSICKWYKGNNYEEMSREDVRQAIEKLSDTLHLPMANATVYRMDIAHNMLMEHPPELYMKYLGVMRYAQRLQEPNGVYYKMSDRTICLYDKNKEQKDKRISIPEVFKETNILRCELRYLSRLPKRLNVQRVTGGMLYDEFFWRHCNEQWLAMYMKINKINKNINGKDMRTVKDFQTIAVRAYIEQQGGLIRILEDIRERQMIGYITAKQAYDLRRTIKKAYKVDGVSVVRNELVDELDTKVAEAAKNTLC